tara:strand:- start:83 stop:472 length:390 start_codon:yes stop_codon:yes gene_type:complete
MTYRIRKKSGLIIPKTPKLILPGTLPDPIKFDSTQKIVEEEIKRIIKDAIGIRTRIKLKRVQFIPIYKRKNGEKEISRIYLKQKFNLREAVIDASDIESTGVMLIEFFDYIISAGAEEIQDPEKALEIM